MHLGAKEAIVIVVVVAVVAGISVLFLTPRTDVNITVKNAENVAKAAVELITTVNALTGDLERDKDLDDSQKVKVFFDRTKVFFDEITGKSDVDIGTDIISILKNLVDAQEAIIQLENAQILVQKAQTAEQKAEARKIFFTQRENLVAILTAFIDSVKKITGKEFTVEAGTQLIIKTSGGFVVVNLTPDSCGRFSCNWLAVVGSDITAKIIIDLMNSLLSCGREPTTDCVKFDIDDTIEIVDGKSRYKGCSDFASLGQSDTDASYRCSTDINIDRDREGFPKNGWLLWADKNKDFYGNLKLGSPNTESPILGKTKIEANFDLISRSPNDPTKFNTHAIVSAQDMKDPGSFFFCPGVQYTTSESVTDSSTGEPSGKIPDVSESGCDVPRLKACVDACLPSYSSCLGACPLVPVACPSSDPPGTECKKTDPACARDCLSKWTCEPIPGSDPPACVDKTFGDCGKKCITDNPPCKIEDLFTTGLSAQSKTQIPKPSKTISFAAEPVSLQAESPSLIAEDMRSIYNAAKGKANILAVGKKHEFTEALVKVCGQFPSNIGLLYKPDLMQDLANSLSPEPLDVLIEEITKEFPIGLSGLSILTGRLATIPTKCPLLKESEGVAEADYGNFGIFINYIPEPATPLSGALVSKDIFSLSGLLSGMQVLPGGGEGDIGALSVVSCLAALPGTGEGDIGAVAHDLPFTASLGDALFTVGGTSHRIQITADGKIRITSDPIDLDLEIGETKEVDLDGDGINDITVTLNKIVDGKKEVTLAKIVRPKCSWAAKSQCSAGSVLAEAGAIEKPIIDRENSCVMGYSCIPTVEVPKPVYRIFTQSAPLRMYDNLGDVCREIPYSVWNPKTRSCDTYVPLSNYYTLNIQQKAVAEGKIVADMGEFNLLVDKTCPTFFKFPFQMPFITDITSLDELEAFISESAQCTVKPFTPKPFFTYIYKHTGSSSEINLVDGKRVRKEGAIAIDPATGSQIVAGGYIDEQLCAPGTFICTGGYEWKYGEGQQGYLGTCVPSSTVPKEIRIEAKNIESAKEALKLFCPVCQNTEKPACPAGQNLRKVYDKASKCTRYECSQYKYIYRIDSSVLNKNTRLSSVSALKIDLNDVSTLVEFPDLCSGHLLPRNIEVGANTDEEAKQLLGALCGPCKREDLSQLCDSGFHVGTYDSVNKCAKDYTCGHTTDTSDLAKYADAIYGYAAEAGCWPAQSYIDFAYVSDGYAGSWVSSCPAGTSYTLRPVVDHDGTYDISSRGVSGSLRTRRGTIYSNANAKRCVIAYQCVKDIPV